MLDLSSKRPSMNAAYPPYERQAPLRCTLAVSITSASVMMVRTNNPPAPYCLPHIADTIARCNMLEEHAKVRQQRHRCS